MEERLLTPAVSYGAVQLEARAGCEKCSGSGFKGRIGIHELMEATSPLRF